MTTTVAMSLAEFLARPEEDRAEWSQGALVMNPPTIPHQLAAKALVRLLDAASPPGLVAVEAIGWLLAPGGPFRIPDVVVAPATQLVGQWLTEPPTIAVEILSPDERPEVKLAEYAAAGLDYYWTFDLETAVLTVYERDSDTHRATATAAPGHVLHVVRPLAVDINPGDLLP